MIMAGSNIAAPNEEMRKIQEDYLFKSIRNPKPQIEARIKQLRIVYSIDVKQYSFLKKSLPFFVCGIFNPPFRRKENFAYTESFIVDIDKLSEKGLSIDGIKDRLIRDERVMMCFASPSEDGLKVMFRFKDKCYDSGIYSVFYKAFLNSFAKEYNLEQVLDSCTSDVSRACFISSDNNAYFNPQCTPIDIETFIDTENSDSFFEIARGQEAVEKSIHKEHTSSPDPDQNIMDKIKERLLHKERSSEHKKEVIVPKEIDEIMEDLKNEVKSYGISVIEIINIQYGKKLRLQAGHKQAEINIFFGKRGFSVVKSPRHGTNDELNSLMAEAINNYLSIN
jgi:hypothetical protein